MKYAALLLCLIAAPAHADDGYNSGYDAGYYTGALVSDTGSDYGRGVEDGNQDAFDEDQQRAQQENVDSGDGQ